MKISVFITSYNQKNFLIEAIESVLNQTLKPYQIIIVDDCSQDGSQDVIKGYKSKYKDLITPIYHENNTGIAKVRTDALKAISGNYVTHVDGDDLFMPEKLENEANALIKNPQVQIAFSNYYYIDNTGIHKHLWIENEQPPDGDIFLQTFARDFPRNSLFRNELVNYHEWKKIGFYDQNLKIYEDLDMYLRLTKNLKAVYIDKPLCKYRIHRQGLSATHKYTIHYNTLAYIVKKNKPMLSDYGEESIKYVKKKLTKWIIESFSRYIFDPNDPKFLENNYQEIMACVALLKEIGEKPWDSSHENLMAEYLLEYGKRHEINLLKNEIQNIYNSWSWKITSPLRKLTKLINELKKK